MIRVFLVCLFCCGLVAAQEDAKALDPNTPPGERQFLIRTALEAEGGAKRFAGYVGRTGVDPAIKHQIVEELFDAPNRYRDIKRAARNFEPIVLLLLGTDKNGGQQVPSLLAGQVARLIQRATWDAGNATDLLEELGRVVNGKHPGEARADLRRAAAIALSLIPHRSAVIAMVTLWGRAKSPAVERECRARVQNVLPADNARKAERILRRHPLATYFDLRKLATDELRHEIATLNRYKRDVLEDADAQRCFAVLGSEDDDGRRAVAARLVKLVKEGQLAPYKPGEFTDKLLAVIAREDRQGLPDVAGNLITALKGLLNGDKKSPLLQEARFGVLLRTLELFAKKDETWKAAALACVELLGSLPNDTGQPLVAFAGRSPVAAVRSAAVDGLGSLARAGKGLSTFIGSRLAALLISEKDQKVLGRLLFNLKDAPVEAARTPIQALLNGGKLSATDTRYCIQIFGQLSSRESLDTLLALAQKGEERVRLDAVRLGLLARKNTVEERKEVLLALAKMVLDDKQALALRSGIVKALAATRDRTVYDLLERFSKVEALKQAADDGKLALAERLARDPQEIDDLRVATRALAERIGGDPKRLEALAAAILLAGKKKGYTTGAARYHHAKAQQALRKEIKFEELRRYYKEAVDNAAADSLAPELHVRLCADYKDLLLKHLPKDKQALLEVIKCLKRLAALSDKEPSKAAAYLLEAARVATDSLKDRTQADALLAAAEKKGAEQAALAEIRKRIDALPKKPG